VLIGAAQDVAKKARNKKDLPEDVVEPDTRFAKWTVMTYQHNVSADQHYHASLERDNAAKMQEEAFRGRSDAMWENNLPSKKELHLLIGVITRHFPCCSHTGALVVLANSGPDHAFLTQLDLSSCTMTFVKLLGGAELRQPHPGADHAGDHESGSDQGEDQRRGVQPAHCHGAS
jgi:hypothetical protein